MGGAADGGDGGPVVGAGAWEFLAQMSGAVAPD
jgi:hypothetical protein